MFLKEFFSDLDTPHPCRECQGEDLLDFTVRMAFQPIVERSTRSVYAYEALVRGAQGEGAGEVIARVTPEQLYRFDQTCRVKAIATAASLGLRERLSINFSPNAVYQPATCIRLTLAAAERCGFEPSRLIFETTEVERMRDTAHVVSIIRDYQSRGFLTAIDDFGAGYAGLALLAEFQPDIVKLDMALLRDIDHDPVRATIMRGLVWTCRELGCDVLAEGVETVGEYRALRAMGIDKFQGYLFARSGLESLPRIDALLWEALDADIVAS
jgi:EAL domain-containing protein (putative c-di-GMP-specific phosphodiesterase class I)